MNKDNLPRISERVSDSDLLDCAKACGPQGVMRITAPRMVTILEALEDRGKKIRHIIKPLRDSGAVESAWLWALDEIEKLTR